MFQASCDSDFMGMTVATPSPEQPINTPRLVIKIKLLFHALTIQHEVPSALSRSCGSHLKRLFWWPCCSHCPHVLSRPLLPRSCHGPAPRSRVWGPCGHSGSEILDWAPACALGILHAVIPPCHSGTPMQDIVRNTGLHRGWIQVRGGRGRETAGCGRGTLGHMGFPCALCGPPWGRVAGPGVVLTVGLGISCLRPAFSPSSHAGVGGGGGWGGVVEVAGWHQTRFTGEKAEAVGRRRIGW